MRRGQTGLTLLEAIFALALVFLLIGAIFLVYLSLLQGWDQIGRRDDLREKLQFGLERVIRDVRHANAISVANHALRFTANESGSDASYIYYLYNSSDVWPPNYNQASYDLRRVSLSGGLNGTFTYGSGDLILTALRPPNNTTITTTDPYTGLSCTHCAVIALAAQSSTETLNVRGYVRPRNI